jgi:hypothetical protein
MHVEIFSFLVAHFLWKSNNFFAFIRREIIFLKLFGKKTLNFDKRFVDLTRMILSMKFIQVMCIFVMLKMFPQKVSNF